jgi:hypothetical protein
MYITIGINNETSTFNTDDFRKYDERTIKGQKGAHCIGFVIYAI